MASLGTTHYTAETRLAVGDGSLPNQAVPGMALASQELAESYARWVNNTSAVEDDSAVQITSSPIPQSAVVRIEATAQTQQAALEGAKAKGDDLVERINAAKPGNDPDEVLKRYEDSARQVAAIEAQVEAAFSRVGATRANGGTAYQSALTQLENARTQQSLLEIQRDALGQRYRDLVADQTAAAELKVIRAAEITKNDASARLQRYGLLGFVLGGLLSLLMATWLERRARASRPGRGGKTPPRGGRPAPNRTPQRAPATAPRPAGRRGSGQDGDEPWNNTDRSRDTSVPDTAAAPARPQPAPARPAAPSKQARQPTATGPARTDRLPTTTTSAARPSARDLPVRTRHDSSTGQ